MSTNKKHLCMNCMSDMGPYEVCMMCGWADGSEARELYHLQPRTILAERYEVGLAVGFGGFGVIYRAWDMQLDTQVAIKEFYPSGLVNRVPGECRIVVYSGDRRTQFEEGKTRFLAEARTMAKFSQHPHIVNVYDFFEENNTAYIVMEYLEGVSLKNYLKSVGGKLSIADTLQIIDPVMDALKAIHKEGIVHRDISPDNIFILPDGRIKVIDFGAARLSMGDKEQTLSVVLKPGYAPPEQYRSKSKQGPFTDIYALGATMYRMVTGEVPEESVDRLIKDEIKLPSELVPQLPKKYENIIMTAMAVNASLRFQTIDAMERALHGDAEVLLPEEQRKRIEKKRRGIIAVTATGLAAIAALIVVAVLFFAPQQRLSMKDIEPCTITTHFDEGLPITSDIRKMADEMLQEDGDVVSVDGGNNEGTGNVCFVTQRESVPSNAADLNKLIRSLDESDYPLLQKYSDRFSGENWIALGFDVPVVFYNAKLMSLYDIDIPYTENKDSYNEKRTIEDFVSMVEPIIQVEECLPVVAADSATGIARLDDYIQEQALDVFCANNGAVMYIGMLSDIPFVQEHLPGYYAVGPLPSECDFMEHISYDCIAYIPENENENILDASMCYLSYYLSEDIQTEMYITNTSVLPMEKAVLSTYINEKYPGTGWLMDFFK